MAYTKALWIAAVIAMLLPAFGDLVGVVGAVQLFSTTVFLPVKMYIQQIELAAWSQKWICLHMLIIVALCVTVAAIIGSVVTLKQDFLDFQVFDNTCC